jgi:proline dehydrogenase
MNLVRRMLVKASESQWLRERAPRYRFIRAAAARFLPGENLQDALAAARRLADDGIDTLLTQLGENVTVRAEAEAVTAHYLDVLQRIRDARLPSEISVKLTQLGVDLDADFCFSNLTTLIERSRDANIAGEKKNPERTLWIDMEQSKYTGVTLDLYGRARKADRNVGVCVQAYLHRTKEDVDSLISMGASVRLVKGAYSELPEIAFAKKTDVDENYFRLAQTLLGLEARRKGVRAVMATHDLKLIARISDWARPEGIAANQVEFAMLYGIQRAEQLRLAREGYRSGVLVSYGAFWFPWFMRRLAERPANVLFLVRNLFSR